MWTNTSVYSQLRHGADALAVSSRQARQDAGLLLRHVLNQDKTWLLAHPEARLTPAQIAVYQALLDRRARHEPIQYILGEQEFFGLRLHVTPAVLIPRPETEHLVEAVLERLSRDRAVRIADVGTGSGAIALALAHALPLASVDAYDLSPDALQIAQENAQAHELSARVRFHQADLLADARTCTYDCIASNPPYVASSELLEQQVAAWEPHSALFAGADGLAVYRRLLPQAADCLQPGGLFAGELGAGQADGLRELFEGDARWTVPTFVQDLQAIERVVIAHRR